MINTSSHSGQNINCTKLVSFFIVMNKLLEILERDKKFKTEIRNLFVEYKNVPIEKTGLNQEILKELEYK